MLIQRKKDRSKEIDISNTKLIFKDSGIKFLTPAERHSGKSEEVLANRTKVYEAAKAAHPERRNGRSTRNWDNIEEV